MSQSPDEEQEFDFESSYADAARQLNKLVRAGRSYSGHERNCCFLNIRGSRFANVSMVSGWDFSDDGRAVALCDWDGDGDLDCWLANRTAPQIRFLRNDLGSLQDYLQIQLQGVESNRDAIGARARIQLERSGESMVLEKTVRCGEGFLACQSRRLHFGIGDASSVSSVEVRWPTGVIENFGRPERVNSSILLVEGSGRVQYLPTNPTPRMNSDSVTIPNQTFATHNRLTQPAPTPALRYHTLAGREIDVSMASDRPTLLTLWASWCQPCLVELSDWSNDFERLEKQLRVVAVSVDGVADDGRDEAEWVAVLERIGFPGEYGKATPQMVDVLQHLHNVIYDHHRPLPVPTSILLDKNGHLRAVYKGPVPVDRILRDAGTLEEKRPSQDLPFTGQWLAAESTHNLSLLVEELFRDGYEAEASDYVERLAGDRWVPEQIRSRLFLAEQLARQEPAVAGRHAAEVIKLDPSNATAHERLALILARNGEIPEALYHFELATRYARPPHARTHYNFGRLLRDAKLHDEAAAQFRAAIRINPGLAQAHEQLALILASRQQYAEAAEVFGTAAGLQPDAHQHRINLAVALNKLGKSKEAWDALSTLVGQEGGPPRALLVGAMSLADMRRYDEAIPLLERFLKKEPDAQDVKKQLERIRALGAVKK